VAGRVSGSLTSESRGALPNRGFRSGSCRKLLGFNATIYYRAFPILGSDRDMPIWMDRRFGMWRLFDAMWRPFDAMGRPRVWPLVIFGLFTAGYVLAAISVTMYSGLAAAAIWWILGGFFVFMLAMGVLVFVIVWQRAKNI
jgi:hypothetical protein